MAFHEIYKGLATSPLNTPIQDADAREIEKMLDSGEYTPFKKFSASLESFAPGERADISVISDDSVDGDKEVFDPKTFDFSRFQKNPVVVYGHNYNIPPIGRSLWQKMLGTSWKAKTQYTSRPANYPPEKEWFPDSIYHMVKEGFLPGKSIGGIAKFRDITAEDIQKNPSWQTAKKITVSVQPIEYSVVPIQCNKNAIVQAVSKGLIFIPDEIAFTDFPELMEILKQNKEIPVIKNFITAEEYLEQQKIEQELALIDYATKIPQIVMDKLDTALGRV